MAAEDLHRNPGWPLIFELVRTVEYRFFHCRRCSCCVAFPDTFFEKAENYGLFVAVFNFKLDKQKEENRGNVCITTADVHCLQCNNLFGVKVD
ncbi:unnamed protein product [Linum tenue]|uniref:Yippee domain-containing protein n=1 Tax=Linum tenue TaxID=586396 RepID=A0AAV0Q7A7_9ROSI|nr:unnamed protein product [Linum tenue]